MKTKIKFRLDFDHNYDRDDPHTTAILRVVITQTDTPYGVSRETAEVARKRLSWEERGVGASESESAAVEWAAKGLAEALGKLWPGGATT